MITFKAKGKCDGVLFEECKKTCTIILVVQVQEPGLRYASIRECKWPNGWFCEAGTLLCPACNKTRKSMMGE